MNKFILAIPLFLFITQTLAVVVPDITEGKKITLSPGISYLWGINGCTYTWGGLKEYQVQKFFDGEASSFSYDVQLRTNYSTGRVTNRIRLIIVL